MKTFIRLAMQALNNGRLLSTSLVLTLLAVAMPQMAWAQTTWSVCLEVEPGCDYTSPEDALNDSVVLAGDIIDMETDTYVLSSTLQVDRSITILANDSVIDADRRRAIDVTGANTNLSLTNVTIRNGLADASGGGAMRVSDGATVTVVNGIFENNEADFGGAVHNIGSDVTLRESVLTGNRATAGDGGGILTDSSGFTNIIWTEVDGNQASVAGGGVAASGASSMVSWLSTFSNNALTGIGVIGVSNDAADPLADSAHNCPITRSGISAQSFVAEFNTLSAYEFEIRGLSSALSEGTVLGGRVMDIQNGLPGVEIGTSKAVIPAGVPYITWLRYTMDIPIVLKPGNLYLLEAEVPVGGAGFSIMGVFSNPYPAGQASNCDSALSPNLDFDFRTFSALDGSGGIVLSGSSDVIQVSTVSGNVGDGVTLSPGSSVSVSWSTITNNSGNGLTAQTGGAQLTGSIIAGNGIYDCDGSTISMGYNLIGDDTNCAISPTAGDLVGTSQAPIDPLLGPLQDNGGRIFTHAIIDPTSPAIDSGSCGGYQYDQRDQLRPGGGECDIGSFEYVSPAGPLQTLINAAAQGAIISVPNGIYTESITIGDGKTLSGSGPGNVIIDASNLGSSAIIASGDFALIGISVTGGSATNGGGIFADIDGTDISLNNVVFGNNSATLDGGAIYLRDGTLTATNSGFGSNAAGGNGGAIFSDTSATISGSQFNDNSAGGNGGAIAGNGTLISSNNTFDTNIADNGGAISIEGGALASASSSDDLFEGNAATRGGAIHESVSNLVVLRGRFEGNWAGNYNGFIAGDGGAIYSDISAAISESVFIGNWTLSSNIVPGVPSVPGEGGAIFYNGALSAVDSTFRANLAAVGGGLYGTNNSLATISGTTFEANDADRSSSAGTGGGAIGGSGTLEISNSTLSGNRSSGNGNGAAIGLLAGSAHLNNVTLAYNTGPGGPLYAASGEPGAFITFSNTLFSNNSGDGTNCSTVASLGYNLFQSAPCQTLASDIVADAQIDFLASNGGPTDTHALVSTSPAVDAANPGQRVIELASALSSSQLSFNGAADASGGKLIPVSGYFTRGSVYASASDESLFDLSRSFSTQFSFQITDPVACCGEPSGDGFTFAIAANPTVLGEAGGRLGVATTAGLGTVSVEFDTFRNGGDVSTNAIGVNVGGFGDGQSVISAVQAAIPGGFDDGNVWTAWIDYRADSQRLEVRVTPDGVRPDLPQLVHTVDIAAEVGANGYYGFTGATGVAYATYNVIDWELFETNCPSFDQRGNPRPEGAACDIGAYEAAPVPLTLGQVSLSAVSRLDSNESYPGVTDIPIINIPIEKLTGDVNNAPESAPLGSFPLGSFPIGSFDLRSSPIGSFPLGSFPIGSFPIGSFPLGSFPLGSFPLSSIPLLREGGWSRVLEGSDLDGAPLQTLTLEQVLTNGSVPASVDEIELRDLAIEGSPLASLSLQGLSLGATTVEEIDQWSSNAGSVNDVCTELANNLPAFEDCAPDDTLLSLEFKGAPVSALSLQSLPLGSFPTTAAPLRSFPIGSFPLGSFPLGSFPLGSFPLGSFPLGSFPLGSFPIGSFPIGSFPLGSFELDGKSFCELYDEKAEAGSTATCTELGINPGTDSLADLVTALQTKADLTSDTTSGLASTPLGSFPLGSFPLGSFPLGSFPLGSFPIGSFPIGSFPIGSFPLGSFPLGSFPIGSFPVGSFPLGSFEIDGKSFCEFYDEKALASRSATCAHLGVNTGTSSLADLLAALQTEADLKSDTTSGIASTPLGSFPIGSFPIGSFPLGSFPLGSFPIGSFPLGSFDLNSPPLSDLSLGDFGGCELIASSSTDDCDTLGLSDSSTLLQVAAEYGSIEASPLGSFPLGSFGISDLPMGSFPIGSFEINGTPLGSFPLGSFDLIGSPIGSFPIGSFPLGSFPADIVTDPAGLCDPCETLADAARAGVINPDATLADLEKSTAFASVSLAEVMDAMTMATLYGDGTLDDIDDLGSLTLGQLLIAMMLKTDFPWETIPLDKLDPQTFSADNFVEYTVDIPLTGTETEPLSVAVTLAEGFLYVKGSAKLDVVTTSTVTPNTALADPLIVDNGDDGQTLNFNLVLGGFSDNALRFRTVPPLALGEYPATAMVTLGSDEPLAADASNGMLTVIPDPANDAASPDEAAIAPVNVLTLGYISTPDDNDYYEVAAPAAGDRVAVFMSNPSGDNDLIMYEPLTTVEAKGQQAESPPLDSVPFEDDGVAFVGNVSEEPNALEDVNLSGAPLASISTNRGTLDESVSAIAGDTAPFTIQVSGYNGATQDRSSVNPYTLRVKVTPRVPSPQCTARDWPADLVSEIPTAGSWTENTNAVFLINYARLAASEPDSSDPDELTPVERADAALIAINNLVDAPGIIDGVVIDVSTITGVDYSFVPGFMYGEAVNYGPWDMNPCDVDAANSVVNAITRYLEYKREESPRLTYVTIVGSDEVIPFARKPDETSIANESTFAGEFSDNALYGALVTRHFLSDDAYGDIDPIPWLDRYLNVPELGVGRLVESAADIQLAAENYLDFGGVLDPQTALSAGYDFVSDASEDIDATFEEYAPVFGYVVEDALIDQPGTDLADAWDRGDFLGATGIIPNAPGDPSVPVDLVSFNMHFDFDEALPSSGDASGDYSSNLISTADLAGADLTRGIWFTVGCHSGTNVPDISVVGGAPSEDWAQSFNRLGALYLAQNAFGLGDTEALALTERLMAIFARNLDGNLTIGQAHAFAKQQYFAGLGLYGEYDYKAMQAATLFGLPMYRYGYTALEVDPPEPLPVTVDPISGLSSASWTVTNTGIGLPEDTDKGAVFSVDGDVQFVHFRPLQPIVRRDVTSPDGAVASGAFLTQLATEDIEVADIAFARPVIDFGENEPEIETDEVVFPTAFTNIANYKAPPPGGGPFEPRDQLNVIVGQFTSPLDGKTSGTERLFREFDTQVFYRPATSAPAISSLAAANSAGADFKRPEFDNVQASVVGLSTATQAAFSVDVTDEGNVLRVAVLYLQSVSGGEGNWVLVDLVNGGGNTWTGGGPVVFENDDSEKKVDYMVQAVDDNGNVANSTFKGEFYVAETIPGPPDGQDPEDPFEVILTNPETGGPLDRNDWNPVESIQVKVLTGDEVTYEYSVDGSHPLLPLTGDGFIVNGDGVHIIQLYGSDGSQETFVLLIDNTPAEIVISRPANGEFVVQGLAPAADYVCWDAGSGADNCDGDVEAGQPSPDNATGAQAFSVNAIDNAGRESAATNSYYVVQQLSIDGPVGPLPLGTAVGITATATDLYDMDEFMTIEWGDGTESTSSSSAPETVVQTGDTFTAEHQYATPGVYTVTVTIEYDGGAHVQTVVYEYAVVYDAQGGFVTGGGWINSPSGAYTPNNSSDEDVTGKAKFGFNSKYKKGQSIPSGSTTFRFAAGDLDFDATVYEWMIISGARARYKGVGTVNDDPELYKFQVTAMDADVSGAGITKDGFRIKIWRAGSGDTENVLYDNGRGTDNATGNGGTTPLGGGSIKVHKAKK